MTSVARLVSERTVLVCAGAGGVGKTTTAAAIALGAARMGRRACVVTIDPAKRLADALGVAALTDEPARVAVEESRPGELWALMLDAKRTFDGLVRRYATDDEQAEAILSNRFYRNISGTLSGAQEYMAVEKLYELHTSGRFDIVIVDTPPTRHALDFLDAPHRLTRFLGNRIFRMLMMPTRAGFRAMNVATHLLLRTISRVVGGEVVKDAVAFFNAFEGMEDGFRRRARTVEELLAAPETAYLVVATPHRDAVEDAAFLADRLAEGGRPVEALVVNRMWPRFGPAEPGGAQRRESELGGDDASRRGEPLRRNLAQLGEMARGEDVHVAELRARAPDASVERVPYLVEEVHDLAGLGEIGQHLFAPDG